ncbi:MAG: hypothetical protein COZ80_08675 [Ignavibacteria bacterium CG_4_8_14_3_um_filter_37_9]|nr:hypothetical protein [Ignavibacteria bacterium]OIO21883.1 MAG: hypothetical protein AUJ54_04195 [Ignavibacteria bacterium CG1_02_37_35]PIP76604.1 MAG: hypothetical protein COW85_13360 [Ignavibacteria bacterium CG22_combo_CG10-13_8_21_14_all_37_15]PIS44473.1 MAG: hypothetical protein COT22_10395 [Ignavibacteria bacterium CG08_land_8_20_14_0_20_37_9]PIW98820.1 MAG: hypothetical protein COZ80_08675 [Ignavibacteria bacterium CG_4_8_14_3_um_filter_37_9]PIX92883.1 MAG: hypothetical protein COZ25_
MLKRNKLFFLTLLIDVLLLLLLYAAFLQNLIKYDFFLSIFFAQIVVLPNFAIGFSVIIWSLQKNEQVFLLTVLGGMLFRMTYILGMVFLLLHFLKINQKYFIFGIFLFYFYFLTAEIFILVKQKILNTDTKI